jgi:hypothetical protein
MDQTNLFRGNVVDLLHLAIFFEALQQDVRAKHIVPRKDVRVVKTQIHVRVGGEVEYGVDVVLLQTPDDIVRNRHVAVEEVEVSQLSRLQQARIVGRAARFEFVKGHDVAVSLVFG